MPVGPAVQLAHIGYVVRSVPSALDQFRRSGYEVKIEATEDELQNVICCLLTDKYGPDIELVAPLGDPSEGPLSSRLARGGGLDHLCYFARDLNGALDEEVRNGGRIVRPPIFARTFGVDVAFALRRSGLMVEFMQQAEG